MDMTLIVGLTAAALVTIFLFYLLDKNKKAKIARRRAYLISKYHDEEIVDKIMKSLIWQGMSEEQLLDSWGSPHNVDTKIYKTKTKKTYKYAPIGRRQYAQRVVVEDSEVVGWDHKTL